ncbi:hypothetical protein GF314_05215 [bacterium]|nr:hypothetical protein [bacterium]
MMLRAMEVGTHVTAGRRRLPDRPCRREMGDTMDPRDYRTVVRARNPRAGDRRRPPAVPTIVLVVIVMAGAARAQDAAHAPDDGLPTLHAALLQEAARANPELQAAREAWLAAAAAADASGKLPDPRLSYGRFLAPVQTRVGPQQHQVGLSQTLPWFGSLGRQRDAAAAAIVAARAGIGAAWLDVRLRLTRALHEIHRIDRTLQIERENLELLEQFESVARARLRYNEAATADLLRLQVELGRAEDRVQAIGDRRAPAVARLNALLGRPARAPFPQEPVLHDGAVDSLALLEQRLAGGHPRLRALRAEAERQERLADVARDRGRPGLTLGVMHTFVEPRGVEGLAGDGDDATLATVSVNLPLWRGKIAAGVDAAQRRQARVRADERDLRGQLQADLSAALYEFDDAGRRVALYRDTLLPKAEESLGATLDAYANGRSDFGELIDVERVLLEFQLSLLEARVDRADARARIASLAPDPRSLQAAIALVAGTGPAGGAGDPDRALGDPRHQTFEQEMSR